MARMFQNHRSLSQGNHRKRKKSSKSEKKQIAPSPKPSPEPSPKETENPAPEDHVSPFYFDLSSNTTLRDSILSLKFFQPDSPSEAIEVTTTSEMPKAKEGRKKRKHKVQEITVETTHTEGSQAKSSSKRRKHGHNDSNPNSAHSCVGDNVSKVIYRANVTFDIFQFMLFRQSLTILVMCLSGYRTWHC
jgi:hypothetical protein